MRNVLPAALALTLVGLVFGCQTTKAPLTTLPTPSQVIAPTERTAAEHEFGEIAQGEDVSHVFTLRNDTGGPVSFTQPPLVEMGCCITAELDKENIEPGQTADLKVTYRTRLRPGPFSWGVKLFPDTQDFPSDFQISGSVTKALVVAPIQLNFDKAGELDFQVEGVGLGVTHKVTKVSTNSPNLKVRLVTEKEESTNKILTYRVTWNGQSLVQKSTPVVYVITDSPKLQSFPVLVYGGTN